MINASDCTSTFFFFHYEGHYSGLNPNISLTVISYNVEQYKVHIIIFKTPITQKQFISTIIYLMKQSSCDKLSREHVKSATCFLKIIK